MDNLQALREERSRRAAAYMAECSRKVSDVCDTAQNLINLYNDGFITASELKSEIAELTA